MMRMCGRCGREKPESSFNWRRVEKGQRDNCRACRAAYKREHYRRNRQRYIDNASIRRARIHEVRMRWLVQYLAEHPCEDCGESDVVVLEFDHPEDVEKRFDITRGLKDRNWQDVLDEISRCDVVCANCHRRRTAERAGFLRVSIAERLLN